MFLLNLKPLLSEAYHQFPFPINKDEWQACNQGPKVLANSFPKGGTHLLTRVLSLTPLLIPRWKTHIPSFSSSFEFSPHQLSSAIKNIRRGQYLSAHCYHNQELVEILDSNHIKTLFIIRDLRDIVVSRAYYLTYKLRTPKTKAVSVYLNSLKNDSERVMTGILGIERDKTYWPSIRDHASAYYPWLITSNCLTIRFEDLVGSNGGGNDEKQIATVNSILRHLEIEVPKAQVKEIADRAFYQKSATFRKGQIGDWQNHFTEEHKQKFKEIAGDFIVNFGYESGWDW